jgi:protein-S-isoprenylcysteine O-methyltransferase Ste14
MNDDPDARSRAATRTRRPWWRGGRGEGYVAAQIVLLAILAFAPPTLPALPDFPLPRAAMYAGAALLLAGGALLLAGGRALGPALTPLPSPRPDAPLVRSGPYRLVRHPIYAGVVLAAYGWALLVNGWLTLVYATVLFVFLDVKARREERWLVERFPGYREYMRRVRRLVPFVY